MAARSGVDHNWAGAHLPTGQTALRPQSPVVADPAHGANLPRCLTCGMPSRAGSELVTFELRVVSDPAPTWLERLAAWCRRERRRLYYRLCAECVLHGNRVTPQEADPLDALVMA